MKVSQLWYLTKRKKGTEVKDNKHTGKLTFGFKRTTEPEMVKPKLPKNLKKEDKGCYFPLK